MKIQVVHQEHQASYDATLLFIPPYEDFTQARAESPALQQVGEIAAAYLAEESLGQYLPSQAGEVRTFYPRGESALGVLVVMSVADSQKALSKAAAQAYSVLEKSGFNTAAFVLSEQGCAGLSQEKIVQLVAQGLENACYHFDGFKSDAKEIAAITVDIVVRERSEQLEQAAEQGVAIAQGMKLLRDLGNMPGNVCTPRYLAKTAEELGEQYSTLEVEILEQEDLEQLKMGSLLSVSKGSIEPPRLIKMHHKGSDDAPLVFVGKGVTFDSGGISLKPGAGMDEMKYDMCGAGAVFGLMKTISELNLPINVIGIVPSVENMPSDRASKPGDIVTAMSGTTIEILNTDAEGRLILCDALTYAQQFLPKVLIDMATLTGAVIVALGSHASGLMSNNDELADALLEAGQKSGDRAWRLPVWDEYTEQLKSPFADLQNIGTPGAGTITAGCFLAEFAKDVPWAHIDIAGTAWQNRKEGATGRPVPLLAEYVFSHLK